MWTGSLPIFPSWRSGEPGESNPELSALKIEPPSEKVSGGGGGYMKHHKVGE